MTIARKLLLYILVPLVSVLLILSLIFYLHFSAFLEKNYSSALLSQAEAINNEIHHYIQRGESDLGTLLINRMIMDYFMYFDLKLLDDAEDARWKIENDFRLTAQEKEEYAAIRLIRLNGRSAVDIIDKKISYKHLDFSEARWFQETLKLQKDESYVSPVGLCTDHNKPGIVVTKLYYNDVGKRWGLGSLHIHIDDFFRNLLDRGVGERGYISFIDASGVIVAHKDPSRPGIDVATFKSAINLLAGESGTITEIDETKKILMKKAYLPTEVVGLGLLVSLPVSEISAYGEKPQLFNLIFLCVTILIISVMVYVSSRKCMKPVMELRDAAIEISKGDLSKRVEVRSQDEIGNLAQAFNLMSDLRQESERAVAEEKERLSVTLQSIGDAVVTTDTQGKILLMNEVAEELTGWNHEVAVGKYLNEVLHIICEDSRKQCENPVDLVMKSGAVVRLPNYTILVAKDGVERNIADSAAPIRDDAGEVIGVVLVFRDITTRKRAEEELKKHRDHLEELVKERTGELEEKAEKLEKSQEDLRYLLEDVNKARTDLEAANTKLKELDRLKSMFIASMSHELRTPLNSIIGFTGIILQGMVGEINAEQRDQLQRVYGSAKHLLELITDVIDISKIEAGKIEPYAEEFRLDEMIKEAISSLKNQIDSKGLVLEVGIPQALKLKTDRRRLLQCILNYLSNAIKFTEKGKIGIAVEEIDGTVEIAVKDTGIGIKEESLTRLYSPFFRIDSPLTLVTPGTGLGLYLTKKIADEVLGGSVSVESKYGVGSVFKLKIPKEIKNVRKNL